MSGKINEVEALSSVFYAFFLEKSRISKDFGEGHEVVRMEEQDRSVNPFYVEDENPVKRRYSIGKGLLTIQEQSSSPSSNSNSINKERWVKLMSEDIDSVRDSQINIT